MKRSVTSIVLALLVVVLVMPTGVLASRGVPTDAQTSGADAAIAPKVVLIVGPTGGTTKRYKALANEAARIAERYTPNVVRLYSPNATWPAVRSALDGASIVVYLGHGNGWPSRYRDSLFPGTQNGFGLNPVAGGDDSTHQYFGESKLDEVKLAENAVVLLHHLCYASGNTEPGLPVGTLDQSVQRVDNYAAGFIRAGARAVVAEGHLGPAYYVKQLLSSDSSIERIWRQSPQRNGNEMAFASVRSAGYTALLDPDRPRSGFYRSLVTSGGVSSADVRGSAVATTVAAVVPGPVTLADRGVAFGQTKFAAAPIVGETSKMLLPISKEDRERLPDRVQVGVRWDPLDVAAAPAVPDAAAPDGAADATAADATAADATAADATAAESSTEPDAAPVTPDADAVEPPAADGATSAVADAAGVEAAGPGRRPSGVRVAPAPVSASDAAVEVAPAVDASPAAEASPADAADGAAAAESQGPPAPPPVELVVAEQLGALVEPVKARSTKSGFMIDVTFPAQPGLYRLVPTLHDADGVAYDAATQALLGAVQVRVSGPLSVAYGVAATLEASAAAAITLPVRLRNSGTVDWLTELEPVALADGPDGERLVKRTLPARLVATWVSATGAVVPAATSVIIRDGDARAGAEGIVELALIAPDAAGEYLLILDVLTASDGALSTQGSDPAIVRVTVAAG